TLALFACIVAHELGHSRTARRYGIGTRDIILLPIGGVGRLERTPDNPAQEFRVALAGPAVSLGIACLLLVLSTGLEHLGRSSAATLGAALFVERLMIVNLVLAVFNLLPAFPMDGGRVLRGLLAMRLDYERATVIAARTGQTLALAMIAVGAFVSPVLLLIGIFVWIGAAAEADTVHVRIALKGVPVGAVMRTRFSTVRPDDDLSSAAALAVRHGQPDFPVVNDHRIVGTLTHDALLRALSERGPSATVVEAMTPGAESVDSAEMLEPLLARLQGPAFRLLPVTDQGLLVGLLTPQAVTEFLSLGAAQRSAAAHRPHQPHCAAEEGTGARS
ncbi:MAG TPA: site-2 protease family protein, partial [Vicinamibacterales bacterium]|nr:site-2 protease family protein [Vicinamibacterales bacterium]